MLVDEIDLHLHPKWQRELIGFLTERFPNTQFIVTAHSPLIVQSAPDANIALLKRVGDHVVIENNPETIRGWRIDQILTSDLFGLETAHPPEMEKLLEEYIRAIDGDKRREATIAALGLNRDKMIERRRDALAKWKLLVKSRDRLADQISQQPNAELIHLLDEITRHLQDCVSSAGEYTAMTRAALRDLTRTSA